MPRDKLFISYSRKDQTLFNELKVHLKPLERQGRLATWTDTDIEADSDWHQSIQTALSESAVGVLGEARGIWNWLEIRSRLKELPHLLRRIERNDIFG